MNILWIEDFGGGLSTGTDTLIPLFEDLLNFDNWDEDERSLLSSPDDLQNYCKDNSALHCVYLCRHYFDYKDFKSKNDVIKKIDFVIIDIRLDHQVDFDKDIPVGSIDKSKFHSEAGFYIFNNLVHFGFPSEKMCFMTGEKGSLDSFSKKCDGIYMPKVSGFEKAPEGYENLRNWIKEKSSDYFVLRRGIIEGCEALKSLIGSNEIDIQFRDFIKQENSEPVIEITETEIKNYLDTLPQSLPIKLSDNESDTNTRYRLFLRTLAHEWEENIKPKSLENKHPNKFYKVLDIYTFSWIMKMTRNWVSHAKLLEPLNAQLISFLFLVNMRAMFKLPKEIQDYEQSFLVLISNEPATINKQDVGDKIKLANRAINDLLDGYKISTEKECFGLKINYLYRRNTGNPDAEEHNYKKLLMQYFWDNQRSGLTSLISTESNVFLPALARHLYKPSFSDT